MKTLLFIYLCALLSYALANINELTGDDLTMYDCVMQYNSTVSITIDPITWGFITVTGKTQGCLMDDISFTFDVTPPDISKGKVLFPRGKGNITAGINTGILFQHGQNGLTTFKTEVDMFYASVMWYRVIKYFHFVIDNTTSSGIMIVIDPLINVQEPESAILPTDSNVRSCADRECTEERTDYVLGDEMHVRISPNDRVPPGHVLGEILSIEINGHPVSIIEQGVNVDESLYAKIMLTTVCSICSLNVTASVVLDNQYSRRLLLQTLRANTPLDNQHSSRSLLQTLIAGTPPKTISSVSILSVADSPPNTPTGIMTGIIAGLVVASIFAVAGMVYVGHRVRKNRVKRQGSSVEIDIV